jgi:hypothetical protein
MLAGLARLNTDLLVDQVQTNSEFSSSSEETEHFGCYELRRRRDSPAVSKCMSVIRKSWGVHFS